MSGVMLGILQRAMAEPTLSQSMDRQVREMMALDHEMAMIAQDLAACKTLADLGHQPMLTADPDTPRARMLDKMRRNDIPDFIATLERLIDNLRSN
jgi:hypothetical protein